MKTHTQIIDAAGGVASFARQIGVAPNTAYPWRRIDSIPAPHWKAVVDAGLATLVELAEAAATKRAANDTPPQEAAA